jgi:hypothetical protein
MKIQKTIKMKPAKKRTKDIFVDRRKVEAIERRESARKYEERKQKLKDFFGFGKTAPVRVEQPISNPPILEKKQQVPEIKAKTSRMRIFDDNNPPKETPGFYNVNRGGIQPPQIDHMNFKKKKHPLDDVVPKPKNEPPVLEQNNEEVGFLERIKRFFKPKEEERNNSDDERADEYVKSINQRQLNFDYNKPYNNQIPENVNN